MLKKWVSSLQLARDVWRRKLGLFLFDKKNSEFELNLPLKRVVLVRWDAKWGDSIVSSFIFREWKRAYPDIKIDVITTANMSGLFKKYFGASYVYEIKKRPSYGALKKLAEEIGEVDLLVHLSKSLKMKDLYFMNKVQAKMIAGLDDEVKLINLKLGMLTNEKHFSDKFRVLLEQTGVQDLNTSYIVPNNIESRLAIEPFMSKFSDNKLVFNPYGSGSSRQLDKEKIVEIIDVINKERKDINIVMLTTPDKISEISSICENYRNVFYYTGSQSIYDSIAIMQDADWIVSVDTATVHIARGLNKPLLALYNPGEDNYKEWHPNYKLSSSMFSLKSDIPNINLIELSKLKKEMSKLLMG